jgi:hypothetical protein
MQGHHTNASESLSRPTLPTPVTTDGKSVDVANQVATRNSLQLQSITAILGMPEDTWMKTDLSGNKNRQVGESAKRREASLPTPTVSDQYTGNLASTQQKPGSMHSVTLAQVFHKLELFPTPLTTDSKGSGPNDFNQLRNVSKLFPTPTTLDSRQGNNRASFERNTPALGAVVHMLPTPVASEGVKATAAQGSEEKKLTGQVWLTNIAHDLATENGLPTPKRQLPTPTASDWKGANHSGSGSASSRSMATVVEQTNWGKFEPAIRRWESILGRLAPEPTKPDGKDGNHRLSSKFTEWMMGLPDGWITGHNLKRNDELKLAGNGVVPQQAELALRLLLELPEER